MSKKSVFMVAFLRLCLSSFVANALTESVGTGACGDAQSAGFRPHGSLLPSRSDATWPGASPAQSLPTAVQPCLLVSRTGGSRDSEVDQRDCQARERLPVHVAQWR